MRFIFYTVVCLFVSPLAFAQEKIQWFGNDIPPEDMITLPRGQYVIQFDDGHRAVHTGMAFPTSESRIVTAAHIFPFGKVGDLVRVAADQPMPVALQWREGKIAQLDPENDFAAIYLTSKLEDRNLILPQCESIPSPGTAVAVYKPTIERNTITSRVFFQGVVTPLRRMPLVSTEVEKRLYPGNYSLRAQSGALRIVAAGSAIPGVSGGAIWDIKRKCVAGIASATGRFNELEDSQSALAEARNPPFTNFLIGALIQPDF